MSRVRLSSVLAVLVLVGVASSATWSDAQNRPAPRAKPRATRGHKGADGGAWADAGAPVASTHRGEGDGGLVTQKTLDGGTKVFRFGELEIEGRLKNPQLVFFLRRVRAEFAAGDLGHRSFLRELGETKHDPNF